MKFSFYTFVVLSVALTTLIVAVLPHVAFALEVPQLRNLPGFQNISSSTQLGDLARSFYEFALAISALLAFGMIIWGGILWLLSAARPAMQLEAKKKITGAVTGVALLLGIFLILNTVNPQLTVLRDIGEQTAVTICENAGFGGDCRQVFKSSKCTSDENCWRDSALGFNKINSLKNPQNIHVSLYKNPDFQNLCAEAYKEQTNLPGLGNDPANAEYYTCGSDQIKSAQLKKENVVVVYEKTDFDKTGSYRALKNDVANTSDSALDLNPAVPENQKFWPASPLLFNSTEIPAGFRVSLYSNTAMRDRCAVLVRSHKNVGVELSSDETLFLAGGVDEYYNPSKCGTGVKSVRVSTGATEKPGIVSLFANPQFDGDTREISANAPLVNMKIQSLKINKPEDCNGDGEDCDIYTVLFDRQNFFGKCAAYDDRPTANGCLRKKSNLSLSSKECAEKDPGSFNVASIMIIRAALSSSVTEALTLYEDVNLNEASPAKKEWKINFTGGKIHIEDSGSWKDNADSALQDAGITTLLFEHKLKSKTALLNRIDFSGSDGVGAGLCEGLTSREKDVLRLRNKIDGLYLFPLK